MMLRELSKNRNKVISLYPGITNLRLNSVNPCSGVTVNAAVGEPYGVIKGKDFYYDDDGKIIIDAESGTPVLTSSAAI